MFKTSKTSSNKDQPKAHSKINISGFELVLAGKNKQANEMHLQILTYHVNWKS